MARAGFFSASAVALSRSVCSLFLPLEYSQVVNLVVEFLLSPIIRELNQPMDSGP